MSIGRNLHKKITLAVYDHKCMVKKCNHMLQSLKEVEKIINEFGSFQKKKSL